MSAILVVEDTPIVREPLMKLLTSEGYEATGAANGVEALEAVKRCTPDLILLDVMMPKMNGVEFLHRLRENEAAGDVPVILLTAVMDSTQLRLAREMRVKEVMFKSRFSVEELMEGVRRYTGRLIQGRIFQ